jgi:hypothetical protein
VNASEGSGSPVKTFTSAPSMGSSLSSTTTTSSATAGRSTTRASRSPASRITRVEARARPAP